MDFDAAYIIERGDLLRAEVVFRFVQNLYTGPSGEWSRVNEGGTVAAVHRSHAHATEPFRVGDVEAAISYNQGPELYRGDEIPANSFPRFARLVERPSDRRNFFDKARENALGCG